MGCTDKHSAITIINKKSLAPLSPGLYLADKLEFKCKSRGVETCLHTRGAALNARETGI